MPRTPTAPIRPDVRHVATVAFGCAALAACALAVVAARGGPDEGPRGASSFAVARGLPPIVFVSRRAPGGADSTQVPGMGPRGRALAPGGRLLVRAADGALRELVAASRFHDVADPTVSFDATTIAFAAVEHAGDPWRLWTVKADGSALTALTRGDRNVDLSPLGPGAAARFARYDDFDPAWLPDGRIVFASTRFPQRAQQGGGDVTNLYLVPARGGRLERITSERNGGEEPGFDPSTGRVVYTRWFFSPWRASDEAAGGLVLGPRGALARPDSVDLWQTVSVLVNGDRAQLAAGDPRERAATFAYAPMAPLARPSPSAPQGTLVAVQCTHGALLPAPGPTRLAAFPGGVAVPVTIAGPGRGGAGTHARALAPTPLPDGRVLFAFDRDDGGDFGLWVVRADGTRPERVVDLPGTLELDPVALVVRPVVPLTLDEGGGIEDLAPDLPATMLSQVTRLDDTFRFDCLNVYATGPVDSPFPDAPRIGEGVHIRFFATLARPEAATGDTAVLVRESAIDLSGAVHEHDIPGDVPLFEQLVDAHGRVLRSPRGPAHVPGANFSRAGSGTKCIGCHVGHSALPAPRNNLDAKWFNAAPSAKVEVASTAAGGRGGEALVDRMARGPVRRTGWIAAPNGAPAGGSTVGEDAPAARLEWAVPIEVRGIVLYAPSPDRKAGTDLSIRSAIVIFERGGREVGRQVIARTLRPEGTRIAVPPVILDAIAVVPTAVRGRVEGRAAFALAEIEVEGRLIE